MHNNIDLANIVLMLKEVKKYDKKSPIAIAKGKYKLVKKKRSLFKLIKIKSKSNG